MYPLQHGQNTVLLNRSRQFSISRCRFVIVPKDIRIKTHKIFLLLSKNFHKRKPVIFTKYSIYTSILHLGELLINIFNNIRSMYPSHGKNLTTAMTSASVRNIFFR